MLVSLFGNRKKKYDMDHQSACLLRSTQNLLMIMRKLVNQPKTTQEELVNDLKAVTVTKKKMVTHYGTEVLQLMLGPPVQEDTCTRPS